MIEDRYIFDALYGPIHFPDYVWKVMFCPELQRLREVRLCNINSLCLTGGANINRYEHSLGAAYLATQCVDGWHLGDSGIARRIVLAALLHDIGSAAFGHSVQYVLGSRGYKHESLYEMVSSEASKMKQAEQPTLFDTSIEMNQSAILSYDYRHTVTEPIYFGMPRRLGNLIPDEELRTISQIVEGEGPYHALINGTMDLDNLDNVYRMAYHVGLVRSGDVPLRLARSIRVENEQLTIDDEACNLVEEWYKVRKRLYHYLLLNPDEFSAKCMLQEALEMAQNQSTFSFYWHDVDYQLLEKLASSSDESNAIISRLMIGDLYGCIGLYSCSDLRISDPLADPLSRRRLEVDLATRIRRLDASVLRSAVVGLHGILDVNKTQRPIKILTRSGKITEIGEPIRRVLVGAFFKNIHLGMAGIDPRNLQKFGVFKVVTDWLKEITDCSQIDELKPYAESNAARAIACGHANR